MAARKAVTKAQLDRWAKASKVEKSAILDAVCEVTGWHRDHARKAIRQALAERDRGGPAPRKQRQPAYLYGPEVIELLERCWAALDGPAGKRLHPALPQLIANMRHHEHLDGIELDVRQQERVIVPRSTPGSGRPPRS